MWAVLADGELHNTYWDGSSWHEWHTLGRPNGVRLIGQPAAAARDAARIDVLAAGDDGAIWHRWWNGAEWVAWERIGSAPTRVSGVAADWVGSRLDVYVRDSGGSLWYIALTA